MKVGELEENLVVEIEIFLKESWVFVGVGCFYMGIKVSIVNFEELIVCEEGKVGEIWVFGGSVVVGYWNWSLVI